jgi:hypothetical protein
MGNQPDPVAILFGHEGTAISDDGQLNSAEHAVLKLLQKALGAAEANSREALQRAEVDAAQNRIAELEALVQHYREKSGAR